MRTIGIISSIAGVFAADPCLRPGGLRLKPCQYHGQMISIGGSGRKDFGGPQICTGGISTTIESRVNPDRKVHQKARPETLFLHFNPFDYDARPRASMYFIGHGQRIGFSLLFDTGSSDSFILEYRETPEEREAIGLSPPAYMPIDGIDHSIEPVYRPAQRGEGYLNVGSIKQTGDARNIYFGTANDLRPVESNGKIKEFTVLYSGGKSFGYEIEIELTERTTDPAVGIGLLGAGRMSHLAKSAGIFSFMGPPIAYTGPATRSAGTIIIGERDEAVLNSNCLEGQDLRFFATRTDISQVHWVVGGSVTMNDKSGREIATTDTNWGLDTGAHAVFVTIEMKMAIKQAMLDNGAYLISDAPGTFPFYKECPSPEVMPSFTFYLGTGTHAFPVVITANDYIRSYTGENLGYCTLEVSDSAPSESIRLIGIQILSKLFTVFDAEHDRLGFCIKRH